MAGLSYNDPLLKPENVVGVFDAYIPAPEQYLASTWYPFTPTNTRIIKWDEKSPLNYGLTLPSQRGAESPIIQGGHMKQFYIEPLHFREKYIVREEDVNSLRRMGTTSEIESPQSIVQDKALHLRKRIQDRVEWMCWQATFGRIALNGENNVTAVYNYQMPTHLNVTLTGTERWNQPTTANPINNIMNIVRLSRGYGWKFGKILMNAETARIALQVTQFRDFFRDAMQGGALQGAGIISLEALNKIVKLHVPDAPDIEVWDGGYRLETSTTSFANTGGASVNVDSPLYLEQNDQVTLVHKDTRSTQLLTLNGGPVANTLNTIETFSTPYPIGSIVRCWKPHIPDGRLVFVPAFNSDLPAFGSFYLTPTEWAPGSLMSPRPGLFFETQDHTNEDPKRIELIAGFEGIAVPQYYGSHALLNVY